MLFWMFVIATVVFGLIAALAIDCDSEVPFCITFSISAFSAIVTAFMLLVIIFNNVGLDSFVAEKQTRYDALVYQYENNFYDNDNDLGKRELLSDITAWNQDLAWHKAAQRDLWLGIFHADIYDQFELISLELDK